MTGRQDRRGDAVRIADIIGASIRLEKTLEQGHEHFLSCPDALDAAIRRLEIIGEAAGKVSDPTRDRYPEVPWRKLRGFASFAKHEYWRIKPEEVWKAVEKMPSIRRVLSKVRVDDLDFRRE